MATTFEAVCPCGCGETVVITNPGFSATQCHVAACSSLRSAGVESTTIRKTAAYALAAPASAGWRHRDGLVTLAG